MQTEIIIRSGATSAGIVPGKGAVVTHFAVDGRDVLYPDCMLPVDGVLRRRGGMPVLFPNAGALPGSPLPGHGFARTLSWDVVEVQEDKLTLSLSSNPETERIFPFAWKMGFGLGVEANRLIVSLSVLNLSARPMPTAPGFHPYLAIPNDRQDDFGLPFEGFSLKGYHRPDTLEFDRVDPLPMILPDGSRLSSRSSDQFKKLMVWSEPGRDFVCVEPWVGSAGALHDEASCLHIQPGAEEVFWYELKVA